MKRRVIRIVLLCLIFNLFSSLAYGKTYGGSDEDIREINYKMYKRMQDKDAWQGTYRNLDGQGIEELVLVTLDKDYLGQQQFGLEVYKYDKKAQEVKCILKDEDTFQMPDRIHYATIKEDPKTKRSVLYTRSSIMIDGYLCEDERIYMFHQNGMTTYEKNTYGYEGEQEISCKKNGQLINSAQFDQLLIPFTKVVWSATQFFDEEVTIESTDKIYQNGRYGFSIQYPDFLYQKIIPENGDGIVLENPSRRVELVVSGSNNIFEDTAVQQYKKDLASKNNVLYSIQKDNWYVISWQEGDKIFYRKEVVGEGSSNGFEISYPEQDKKEYDSVVETLYRTFKTPGINEYW